MRSIKILMPLLALCFMLLVSAVSADIGYSVVIPGGSAANSADGGAVSGAHGYTIFDSSTHENDLGSLDISADHISSFDAEEGIRTTSKVWFDHVLSEVIWAGADIGMGQTGDAAASFTTNGIKAASQMLSGNAIDPDSHSKNVQLITSLDGNVGVTLNKDTVNGKASAEAAMGAQAAVDGNGKRVGGDAYQTATVLNTGLGAGSAFTTGDASFTSYGGDNFAFGYANGNINIQGSNDAVGGSFSGTGLISAMTWNSKYPIRDRWNEDYARDSTIESLVLNANRGISFDGTSKVDGTLNGQEAAESQINNDAWENHIQQTVDIESTSMLDGTALALLARDNSDVNLKLESWAKLTEQDSHHETYQAQAGVDMDAYAQTERHVIGGTQKAMAEGYIPIATWTATADGKENRGGEHLASVTGSQGPTEDGQPTPFQGFGVGAWIQDEFNNPVSAEVIYKQYAGAENKYLKDEFHLYLNGMLGNTGKTNDAVGAFGGIKNAYSSYVDDTYQITKKTDLKSTYGDISAIEWLEGNNQNPLPGHYFPYNMVPVINMGATYRNIELNWQETNP